MAAEKKNSEILKEVCELSRQGKFIEAREAIIQASGVDRNELAQIAPGGRGAYIISKSKSSSVERMIAVERAFYSLAVLFNNQEDGPSAFEAQRCIDGLEDVLPVLNKEQRTYARFWMSNCYAYAEPDNDNIRYELLTEVIKSTPKGKPGSDSLYASCAFKFSEMDIPAAQRYEGVKLAKDKTDVNHPLIKSYDRILPKLAKEYYEELVARASDREAEYSVRNGSYETALAVVNDFNISKMHKNAYKLHLLERQTLLQREYRDHEHYQDSMRRKYNLIYQQAALRKKFSGVNMKSENYR